MPTLLKMLECPNTKMHFKNVKSSPDQYNKAILKLGANEFFQSVKGWFTRSNHSLKLMCTADILQH